MDGKYKIEGHGDSWTLSLAGKINPILLENLVKIKPKFVKINSFYIDSIEVTNE